MVGRACFVERAHVILIFAVQGNQYLADVIPQVESLSAADNASVHPSECTICFEEFRAGDHIARLGCLCVYHQHCIEAWFSRGHSCPVHYR